MQEHLGGNISLHITLVTPGAQLNKLDGDVTQTASGRLRWLSQELCFFADFLRKCLSGVHRVEQIHQVCVRIGKEVMKNIQIELVVQKQIKPGKCSSAKWNAFHSAGEGSNRPHTRVCSPSFYWEVPSTFLYQQIVAKTRYSFILYKLQQRKWYCNLQTPLTFSKCLHQCPRLTSWSAKESLNQHLTMTAIIYTAENNYCLYLYVWGKTASSLEQEYKITLVIVAIRQTEAKKQQGQLVIRILSLDNKFQTVLCCYKRSEH